MLLGLPYWLILVIPLLGSLFVPVVGRFSERLRDWTPAIFMGISMVLCWSLLPEIGHPTQTTHWMGFRVVEFVVVTDVPGDVDGDGNVDLTDMGLFEAQFGQSGLPLPPGANSPDLDKDGDVDLDDLVFIRDNFGYVSPPSPSASAATPEPATMTVLALGGLMVLRRRRKG